MDNEIVVVIWFVDWCRRCRIFMKTRIIYSYYVTTKLRTLYMLLIKFITHLLRKNCIYEILGVHTLPKYFQRLIKFWAGHEIYSSTFFFFSSGEPEKSAENDDKEKTSEGQLLFASIDVCHKCTINFRYETIDASHFLSVAYLRARKICARRRCAIYVIQWGPSYATGLRLAHFRLV